ncbi:MAG TPA: hypothetical protein VMB50_00410 [Myxococcales bacterium]|nr:hypothetical protein [Myxococcales bacterium]
MPNASTLLSLVLAFPGLPARPSGDLRGRVTAFQARFELAIDDGKTVDRSSGHLFVRPGGVLCLAVEKPIHQQLSFGRRELDIYYPDDKLVMRGRPKTGQLPPMIDALFLGFIDPSALLPPTAKVIDQQRDDATHSLTTRWSLVGVDGKPHGQLLAVEAREGTERLDLMTDDGRLMGRYDFSDRVQLSHGSIPRKVEVLHRRPGIPDRIDHWTLQDVAAESVDDPVGSACGKYPSDTPIKELHL